MGRTAAGCTEVLRIARQLSALVLLSLTASALTQAHYATGTYVDRSGQRELTLQLFVDEAGELTGSLVGGTLQYMEGNFEDGRATGRIFGGSPEEVSFALSLQRDVVRLHVYEGSAEDPPTVLTSPRYLLRLPGPGPDGPIDPPLNVLVELGRGGAVLATGHAHSLELRDAEAFVAALTFVLRWVGFESGIAGRAYLSWIERLATRFELFDPLCQAVLVDSASYWPALREDWSRATEDARRGVTAELLLMAFGSEEIGAWLDETHDGGQHDEVGSCATLFDCVTRFFDAELMRRAVESRPCVHLEEFPLSASP